MNAIYKVIWNDAIRQYQVVNELCRSRRKACSVKAVHTDGIGRSLRQSVLATVAAGMMLGGGSALATSLTLDGFGLDLGGGRVTTGMPTYNADQLPGAGESFVIDLGKTSFTGMDQSVFNQDEADRTVGLFQINGSWSDPGGLSFGYH